MRKILFLGAPGAGKGVQAELLKKYSIVPLSVGGLIRKAMERRDPIVCGYEEKYAAGNLLPDDKVFSLVEKELKKIEGEGYVLDGFARNVNQAEKALKKGIFNEAVFFELPEEVAVKRIIKRAKIEKRSDDNPEAVKTRFNIFKKETVPVVEFLKKNLNKFHILDGSLSVEEIHNEVVEKLGLK